MPTSQPEDDTDFVPPVKPQKGGKPTPQQQPKAETTPEPEPAPKSRFPARMVREAEEFGFTQEDLEECATTADLSSLLKYEREKQSDLRASKLGRAGTGREGSPATEVPTSPAPVVKQPTPEPEEQWVFEEDMTYAEDWLKKEMGRLGKAVLKASKGSASKEELADLKKQLAEANTTISALKSANDPGLKRAMTVVEKYPALFGTEFNEHGFPPEGTDEFDRFVMMTNKIRRLHQDGKATVPEKDIPAAIASLFPGAKADGEEVVAPPVTPPSKQRAAQVVVTPTAKPAEKNGTHSRIEEWNNGAQAVPTGRNGADKTGIASDKEAKKEIAKHLRKAGAPTETATEEDDMDDF